jgi:V/A-type H+-transporting ATPase subunit F
MEYYIIAERELVLAFGLAGVRGSIVSNRTEALDAFRRVSGSAAGHDAAGHDAAPLAAVERPKVLLVTEDVEAMLQDELYAWQLKSAYPVVVVIPGIHGHLTGRKSLTDAIREAVGIHV